MKTFSVAVAVAVVLTFLCLQESSAVPVSEIQEQEKPLTTDSPAAAHEETSEEYWEMPYNNQLRRRFRCRLCCNCCIPNACGICCSIRF